MAANPAFRTVRSWRLRVLPLVLGMAGIVAVPAPAHAVPVSEIPDPSWGVGGCPPRQRDDCPRVWAIAVGNGRVYLGGDFTEAVSPDGLTRVPRNWLVALNAATGELDTGFLPAPDGPVRSLALSADGTRLFVGGIFGTIGGAARRNLAALDPGTGAAIPGWRADASAAVWALAVGNGRLYAGGNFSSISDGSGSHSHTRIAALDAGSGAVDDGFNASASDFVQSVVLSPDNSRLYVGGLFTALNGQGRQSVGAIDAFTGALHSGFDAGSTPRTWAIAVDSSRLYLAVGGGGGELRGLDPDTGRVLWRNHQDGDFQAVAVLDDVAYGGGHFTGKLIAVNAATGAQYGFDAAVNSGGGVFRLVANGRYLYLGGDFTRVSGATQEHYARLPGAPVAPPAPTGVTAVEGDGEAVVSWTPPSQDGGSPITGYAVTPYRDGLAGSPRPFTSTATTQTVTGLDNGTAYSFRVAAVSAVGSGEPSAPSPAVTPRTTPAAPGDVTAMPADGSATVSWTPPAHDGGGPVTGYVVTPYRAGVPDGRWLAPSATTSLMVTGLVNGASYAFTVAATNAAGTGPESPRSAAVTPRTRPGAPVNVVAVPAGDRTSLRWNAPPDDGGAPVTAYLVTTHRNGGVEPPRLVPSTVTFPVSIDVSTSTPVTFTVAAVNAAGTGPASAPVAPRSGYWMVGADGRVYAFGAVTASGGPTGALGSAQAVDLEPTPSLDGYWVVDSAGRVFAYGDARHHGAVKPGQLTAGEVVTTLSATRSGGGYWLFTSRGRVFAFGDAAFLGDLTGVHLNGPVLDSAVTPTGNGYAMAAGDGGIFTFGDAAFLGSMGGTPLNAPVQAIVPDPDGTGYWLVASDGGVFAYQAPFRGSMGGTPLNQPITGMVPFGNGYLMVAADGGAFNFSNLPFFGSLGGTPPGAPITAVAATRT